MINNKKNSAFTLIELLVVIVIIGILTTISVASFRGYIEKSRLAKARHFAAQAHQVLLAKTISSDKSLTAYWRFDEQSGTLFKDSSGSGNEFTSNDSGYNRYNWTDETSVYAGSGGVEILAGFLIQGSGVAIPLKNAPEKDSFSISAWIKPAGFGLNQYGRVVITNLAAPANFRTNNDGTVSFNVNGGVATSSSKLSKNRWHHLLGSYNGQEISLYLDGELVAKTQRASSNNLIIDTIQYMAINNGSDAYKGFLDEVIIYPVSLEAIDLK